MGMHDDKIYKSELIDLYRRVAEVLRANGIEYYAAYGTCLGAVRHKGIIPWDDDIDIAVWRKDLQRALRALNESGAGVVAGGGGPSTVFPSHYGRVFNRIEKGDTLERYHAYLDIFTLDYADNSFLLYRLRSLAIVGIERILSRRAGLKLDRRIVHLISDLAVSPLRILGSERLREMAGRLYFTRKPTRFVKVPGDGNSNRCPISCYSSALQMDFDGATMPVPVGYDQILTSRYGDWRTPPPVDQRVGNAYAQDGKTWNVKMPEDADRLKI